MVIHTEGSAVTVQWKFLVIHSVTSGKAVTGYDITRNGSLVARVQYLGCTTTRVTTMWANTPVTQVAIFQAAQDSPRISLEG